MKAFFSVSHKHCTSSFVHTVPLPGVFPPLCLENTHLSFRTQEQFQWETLPWLTGLGELNSPTNVSIPFPLLAHKWPTHSWYFKENSFQESQQLYCLLACDLWLVECILKRIQPQQGVFVHKLQNFSPHRNLELFPKGIGEEICFRKKWS